jgi:hypothetical protein
MYDVFYGRMCGGFLTEASRSNPSHTVTLIAHTAGYLMMFKNFLAVNKKSGWWVIDPHLLVIATNMKKLRKAQLS